MVSDIVINHKNEIIIPTTKLDTVLKPRNEATHSKMKGNKVTINKDIDEKYHTKAYFIGILPFLRTMVVIINNTIEKIINVIIKELDITYSSLFLPL